jgi:putative DNA primase/helicase
MASPVLAFTRDCCNVGPNYTVWSDNLYEAWKAWCHKEGRTITSNRAMFGRDLVAALPTLRRREGEGRRRYYEGIA